MKAVQYAGVAMSAIAVVLATPSFAQSATSAQPNATPQGDQSVDEKADIVVIGSYARSLKAAQDKKRESPVVIEALSISDLNQLPDVSIGDALARLPGLAADRDPNNGAASQISIRGMGAALALGTLNGRDLATASADRNIRYDQFPSELIGGAIVYKSPMASIQEGGISGSIDLNTVKPLDYKKNVLTLDLRGMYSQLGDQIASDNKIGVHGSASFIGRLSDTLGVAIGYSGRSEPYNSVSTSYAGFDPGGYVDINGDGRADNTSYQLNQTVGSGDDERHGVVAVVEWKPSSVVHVTLDGLWSKVNLNGKNSGVIADRTNNEFANSYTNSTVVDKYLVAGTVTAAPPYGTSYGVILQDYASISRRNDRLFSLGGNIKFTPSGRWEGALDVGYSKVRYQADYYELRTQPIMLQGGAYSIVPNQSISFDARNEVPTFGNSSVDLTNPSINRPATLNLPFYQSGRDNIFSAKADLSYDVGDGFFDKVRVGARFVDRSKSNVNLAQSVTLPIDQRPVLSGSQLLPYPLRGYNGKLAGSAPQYLAFDFYNVADTYFGGLNPVATDSTRVASWHVSERTMAGYGQLDFGNGPLTGNIGVRVIKTNTSSSSVRLSGTPSGTTVVPFTVKNDYTDVLPSLNLTYRPGNNIQLRLGLAKTIARPAIDDLNAGFAAFDFGTPQLYGGNPLLEPFRANQVDLSAEWYFGKNDYVAVAGFYKDLKSYITTSVTPMSFNGKTYQAFQPVNGKGGYIRGVELTMVKSFDELPAPFDGFGIYANYSYVESDVVVSRNFAASKLGLIGLSKHTGTAAVWWYKKGFEARLSYNYRSPFARVFAGGGFDTNDAAGYLDAQFSVPLIKGVSGVVQVANITNEPVRSYLVGNPGIRGQYTEYGRAFYAGVRATF